MSTNRIIATVFLSAFATVILFVIVAILSVDDGVVDLPLMEETVASTHDSAPGSD